MKSILREKIEKIYRTYNYESKGCKLTNNKNMFTFKGLEFCAIKGNLFRIGFNNSNVPDQEVFNYLKENYGITVHYGKYQAIKFDIAGCKEKDLNKKKEYPDRAYYTCDELDEDKAIKLFDCLYNLNSY